MAINPVNKGLINAYQKTNALTPAQANPENQGKRAHGNPELPVQASEKAVEVHQSRTTLRQAQQADLVAHLFSNPEQTSHKALKITFQEAIDKLNEILTQELGQTEFKPISDEALQAQGGLEYWSPENTAKRIVDGSTAMLAAFQKANPNLEGEALINRFMDVIGNGITQGFDQAKGVLGDLNVLEGEVADNIEQTFQLVQQGLQAFKENYLNPETETAETEPLTSSSEATEVSENPEKSSDSSG
ncbi:DUF5610 domain-containing protein [Thiomicrorhabdus sp. zzn3]|uniref:DUF5610 domain-containing protein n=1 Tax=Thiomicrorhabdus sp. zzn3 TaxID=3039775 RepID=UPI002436A67A|nr:DUF5610 domain-containing protein [Thiomicrorhabdus sp. zzn3]MDG6777789.1 DUF5610 domain-containing protein [Thiomicrorhabdus sp. zzn3]